MSKQLEISVVTPYRSMFEGIADSVQIPLFDGLAGIQPGHATMFARLGPGKLTVHQGSERKILFVDGGFLEVAGNRVTVLAHNALAPEEIKADEAVKERDALLARKTAGDEEIEERLEKLRSVRARLSLVK